MRALHTTLLKQTPLHDLLQTQRAIWETRDGWQVAARVLSPEREREGLASGSTLTDWSHVCVVTVRGRGASRCVNLMHEGADEQTILEWRAHAGLLVARLTSDEFLLVSERQRPLPSPREDCDAWSQGGGMACLDLAGPRRNEVWERSTFANLRDDLCGPGRVTQTTVHGIRCTILRGGQRDLLLCNRDLAISLYEALLDVGEGVGLVPAGLQTCPVALESLAEAPS